MVCSSVVMGQCTFRYGLPPEISIVIGLAFGTLCGLVSGILVAIVRLPPFIVTLGMWQIVLAANFLYSRNETIRSQDISDQAPILQFFGRNIEIGGAVFTYGVIAMLILAAVVHYLLTCTAWGRHVYAVGDDPKAAELAGVRSRNVLLTVYAGRANLRLRRLDAHRPAGVGLAYCRAAHQHRDDHCRGHRGDLALRRARQRHRQSLRRTDRRHLLHGASHRGLTHSGPTC